MEMRQKAEERKNWVLRVSGVLLVMVLISMRMVGGLYARYTTVDSGADSARTAAFVFTTQDGASSQNLDLSHIQKPGDAQSYVFTVSNKSGSSVSEVTEQVRFDISLNGSLPLQCTVYRGTEPDGEQLGSFSISDSTTEPVQLPVVWNEVAGTFQAAAEQTNTYTLKVAWPEEKNDVKYASRSGVAEIVLTVTAQQVD